MDKFCNNSQLHDIHNYLHEYPQVVRHIPHEELIKCVPKGCQLCDTKELYNIFVNIHYGFRDIFDNYLVKYIDFRW
jgi:hypothetical protein